MLMYFKGNTMKRIMLLLTLFLSISVQADTNTPLIVALNEPDQLLAQRQAAVERLHKLLEQKQQGIKPTAKLPVVIRKIDPIEKPVQETKALDKKNVTVLKNTQIAKVVESASIQTAKQKIAAKKKINIAVIAWGGDLIDDHHFERLMSDRRLAQYMISTMSEGLDKVLDSENNYTKVINGDKVNSIIYEGDNNGESKRACSQYNVDKVVVVAFSRYATSGAAEIILFDCTNGQKKTDSFELDTAVNERYYLEQDFRVILSKFYKSNIGLLSL